MPELKKFGVAGKDYENAELAKGDTYTRLDGSFPPTNLACDENPYKDKLKTSKYILDFGCGVGRNIPWIMENTTATYIGLDPNTTMTKFIWDIQDKKWKDRVIICNNFDEIPNNITFDYVISTFVLQHLGYRYGNPSMNLTDMTQAWLSKSRPGTVFFHIEHDSEEDWIGRWKEENNIEFDVYIRSFKGLPELTDRDETAPNGGHHLMIWKNR